MSFTEEEVAELRTLLEVEKIRKVINLYSQLMDARDIDAMAQVYTEDAIGIWGPYGTAHGRAEIHHMLSASYPGRRPYDGLHCTTNPWIELTGPATALSRTYLIDVFPGAENAANPVVLYATYENDYRKVDGAWKIARSEIAFIWPERLVPETYPRTLSLDPIG